MIERRLSQTLHKLSLTPAETRLTIALFKGQSVTAYARQTGISIHTARWHVKHVYEKAGVNRQIQLFHKILLDMDLILEAVPVYRRVGDRGSL